MRARCACLQHQHRCCEVKAKTIYACPPIYGLINNWFHINFINLFFHYNFSHTVVVFANIKMDNIDVHTILYNHMKQVRSRMCLAIDGGDVVSRGLRRSECIKKGRGHLSIKVAWRQTLHDTFPPSSIDQINFSIFCFLLIFFFFVDGSISNLTANLKSHDFDWHSQQQ